MSLSATFYIQAALRPPCGVFTVFHFHFVPLCCFFVFNFSSSDLRAGGKLPRRVACLLSLVRRGSELLREVRIDGVKSWFIHPETQAGSHDTAIPVLPHSAFYIIREHKMEISQNLASWHKRVLVATWKLQRRQCNINTRTVILVINQKNK